MAASKLAKLYASSPVWIQNAMVTGYGAKIHFERYGHRFETLLNEFEARPLKSSSELEDYQLERLGRILRHAYEHVPYYRDTMRSLGLTPKDFRTLADLPKLPVLDRETLKHHPERLLADNIPAGKRYEGHTSGTTGSPLTMYWDRETCIVNTVAFWRHRRWAGFQRGDRLALALGRVVVPLSQTGPPYWRFNRVHQEMYLSSFHMRSENLRTYIRKMREFGAQALEAYPSTAYILARYLQSRAQTLPLKCVFTSSETLREDQRAVIESSFACKVFDFFGMAERVLFAGECEAHHGHHLNLDYGITEIMGSDGQPAGRGQLGRLVATGLHNLAQPLIRYVTSDVSSIRTDACPCGRNFPLMDAVTTKAEDIVTTADGRYISSSVLTHPFKPLHNIVESQIVQEDRKRIVVKVVRSAEFSDADTRSLHAGLTERLGAGMTIDIEFVDEIPRTAAGKLRWVVSKVPLQF